MFFVEIVRLFIVFLATAGGYVVGGGSGAEGNGPVIGSTLGACLGYVAGGIFGRLVRQVLGHVEEQLGPRSAARLMTGAIGAFVLGGLSALVSLPFVVLLPGLWGWPVYGLLVWIGIYEGYGIASSKSADLLAMAGLSTRPLVRADPYAPPIDPEATLIDTSAIIDGRLLAVVRAGFLREALLVPRFVVEEVHSIADAHDLPRRRRGRKALDLLEAIQRHPGVRVHVVDDEVPEHHDVDAKLVALARRLHVGLVTVDEALQRVAELQGVRCLNLNRLADGLRPSHVPGELIRLPITREGREPGQGIGFLDDGTMVVVGDAASLVGKEVEVRVTGNAQSAVGPMLFGTVTKT